jgi:hypothetical protein
MLKKIYPAAVGAAMMMMAATAASAGQPAQLSDSQMDGVTAGAQPLIARGLSLANAAALAIGEVTADTSTQTSTNTSTAGINPLAWISIGQAASQAIAAGGFLFNAGAVSHSDTAASL